MPNQAALEAIINKGSGIAANILGSQCNWYRATDANTVIAPSAKLGVLFARFDAKFDFKSTTPNVYGHPVWGALCDRTRLRVGDVLEAPEATYFVIAMQPLLPTAVVEMSHRVTLYRPGQAPSQLPGSDYYGGNATGLGLTLGTGWPASILQGPKGEADKSGAIGSARQPWAAILLPAIANVELKVADILVDDRGRRWTLSGVEPTNLGYRCTAAYEGT